MDTDLHQIIRSEQQLTDDHCQVWCCNFVLNLTQLWSFYKIGVHDTYSCFLLFGIQVNVWTSKIIFLILASLSQTHKEKKRYKVWTLLSLLLIPKKFSSSELMIIHSIWKHFDHSITNWSLPHSRDVSLYVTTFHVNVDEWNLGILFVQCEVQTCVRLFHYIKFLFFYDWGDFSYKTMFEEVLLLSSFSTLGNMLRLANFFAVIWVCGLRGIIGFLEGGWEFL